VNIVGPDIQSARFVTPDEDVSLFMHCHVPAHDRVGMTGRIIVGKGGERVAQAAAPAAGTPTSYAGVGVVIAAVPRAGRLIVNHEEIKGFMGPMEMSYPVTPPTLLDGLNPGDKIGFTIDPARSTIVAIEVLERAR
jgi:Cu/Ag efflux protein CusF